MRLIARARSLWRGVRRRTDVETEMNEEFRLHLELRAADLVRAGLSPADAARTAKLEFGATEQYKDQGREARGLRRVDQIKFSWLDFKLGFRMLVRYPWLTLVGGFAMAFAIWAGAGAFEFVRQVVNPTLPLDDGGRIVALRNWDAGASTVQPRVLHDFVTWRDELQSIVDLGAARTVERNLITREGLGEPVEVAEMTASGFRLTRVPPLLGRTLASADDVPGAPDVLVIGYDAWQRRFAGDPNVVGRSVQLNGVASTVVGVMPQGFAFPVSHQLWVPLRLSVLDYERGEGPALQVFGRLAPNATLDEANAEVTTLGQRAATQYPKTHQHLRPQVMRYARSVVNISPLESAAIRSVDVFLALLLMLICGNVALLLFARAATRENEIIVRTALGASRARIITQLFAEALVLSGIAAIIGLAAASFGLDRWLRAMEGITQRQLPFWFDHTLAPSTLVYSGLLALLGAVIAGVIPAVKITRGVSGQLRQATAGGGGGVRFGGIWTAIIVMQVAVTVTFPAVAFYVRRDAVQVRSIEAGIHAHEYLAARLVVDQYESATPNDSSVGAFTARFAAIITEVERKLRSDPNVVGVTLADWLPLMSHDWQQIEVDEGAIAPHDSALGHRVSVASLDVDYFDVLGAPLIAGRRFYTSDVGTRVAIVNAAFVDSLLQGRNAIGRRVRRLPPATYTMSLFIGNRSENANAQPEPWFEIIGVAKDLGMKSGYGRAGIYYPVARGAATPTHIAVHVRGDPRSFIPKLRQAALATDPSLRVYNAMPLNEATSADLEFLAFWFRLTMLVSAVALLLSLTGIYAVMSFTVSRRTREIGLRVALGADPRRIVSTIFRRPLAQVALGIALGGVLVTAFSFGVMRGALWPTGAAFIVAYAVLMMGVCALACIVPTRRALRIEPTDALRAEG